MNSGIMDLVFALLAGAGMGFFYFIGLWWTVRKLSSTQRPALLSVGSFMLRTGVVLAGFYFIMGGRWERLLACLVGFMTARIVLVIRLRPGRSKSKGMTTSHQGN
jgi:F1F0 ATPase subunit 2